METWKIGAVKVTRVLDILMDIDPKILLPDATPENLAPMAKWLKPHFVNDDWSMPLSIHAFIVESDGARIVVDTCIGNDKQRGVPQWSMRKSTFLDDLARRGAPRESIDFVLCTHLHVDHVGFNTTLVNGKWTPTFPNARYVFARREYEHWEKAHRKIVAEGGEPLNLGSFADSVLPIVEAKRAVFVESDHEFETGVHLEPAPGHTPGNCVLHAANGGRRAVMIGDVMHTPVQFAMPSISSRFCEDPVESAKTRVALCERYAETDTVILACHFPTPTAGRIARHRSGFKLEV